jgi:hypothetical protein
MRISILLALSLSLFFSFAAAAAEDGTLSLSPATVMLSGDYGQSTTQTLMLRNGTSRHFSFDLVAQDVVTRNGERAFVDAGAIAGSIAATAVFSPKHVEVPPGQTVVVNVTVTLPPATGQRAIVAMFRGTNMVMSGHVPMTASLGALMTFSVSDAVELSAAPLEVQTQSATSNLSVSHACSNAGKEPLVAKGVMAILDGRGALVGKSPLESKRLLPGESARLGGEYAGELDPGKYRVFVTWEYEGKTLTRDTEVEIR